MSEKKMTFDERVDYWTQHLHSELLLRGGPGLRTCVFRLLSSEEHKLHALKQQFELQVEMARRLRRRRR